MFIFRIIGIFIVASVVGVLNIFPGTEYTPPEIIPQRVVEVPVTINSPLPQDIVVSPLNVEGFAPGNWFFEATIPVVVRDDIGRLIGQGFVTAKEDWMQSGPVPFAGSIIFKRGEAKSGIVIIKNNNPSGDTLRDLSISVPVDFVRGVALGTCKISFCSGDECSNLQSQTNTCITPKDSICFKEAICERDSSDVCGWRITEELSNCLPE